MCKWYQEENRRRDQDVLSSTPNMETEKVGESLTVHGNTENSRDRRIQRPQYRSNDVSGEYRCAKGQPEDSDDNRRISF